MRKRAWIAIALATVMAVSAVGGTVQCKAEEVPAEETFVETGDSEDTIEGTDVGEGEVTTDDGDASENNDDDASITESTTTDAAETDDIVSTTELTADTPDGITAIQDDVFDTTLSMDGTKVETEDGVVSGLTAPMSDEYTADKAPTSGNINMQVSGTFNYVSKQTVINRINQIREEAAREHLASSYVPIKWSYDLETVARARAVESMITFNHATTSGKTIWYPSNGVYSNSEVLAWNYSGLMQAVEQWYNEKADLVNHTGGVTDHYEALINPNYKYCAVACFKTDGVPYWTACGRFSADSRNLSQSQYANAATSNVELEFNSNYYRSISATGSSVLLPGATGKITAIGGTRDGWQGRTLSYPITGGLTWTTSNASAIQVDAYGNLRAVGAGSATVTCAVTGNTAMRASQTVMVKDDRLVRAFCNRLYNTCLGRPSDPSGLEYWNTVLLSGEKSGAQVARGFVFSEEYMSKNTSNAAYVEMLYRVFMDRASDAGGKAYWVDLLNQGLSREYVFRGFVQSVEYDTICRSYGITRGTVNLTQARDQKPNLTKFVNRLYTKALGRAGEEGGLNYWCQTIQAGSKSPEQAAESFITSVEFKNKHLSDEEYIKTLYRTFMGREYDAEGLAYWKSELAKGCSRENILHRFATSKEFKNIQSSFGL